MTPQIELVTHDPLVALTEVAATMGTKIALIPYDATAFGKDH